MSMKSTCLGVLVGALLGLGVVRGQEPTSPADAPAPAPGLPPPEFVPPSLPGPGPSWVVGVPPQAQAADAAVPVVNTTVGLNPWLAYPRGPGCCCPVGRNGPIGSEVYLRVGPSFPIGGGVFGNNLTTGWAIAGGGRVLFFDPQRIRAWTIDLGLINMFNTNNGAGQVVSLNNVSGRQSVSPGSFQTNGVTLTRRDVTVQNLNQTLVSVSGGREWWLWGTAACANNGLNWRAGFDGGGRYGTAKVDINEVSHVPNIPASDLKVPGHYTDALGGLFFALHSDLEKPCRCCILQAGLRVEYGYTWTDILQHQNPSDLQYINLLFTFGSRF